MVSMRALSGDDGGGDVDNDDVDDSDNDGDDDDGDYGEHLSRIEEGSVVFLPSVIFEQVSSFFSLV